MANFHHNGTIRQTAQAAPEDILTAVETFLSTCRSPAALEQGEEIAPLKEGEFSVEIRAGRVCIDFTCGNRVVSRRITAIDRNTSGLLECTIQRFAGKPGKLSFLDLQRPQTANRALRGTRESFGERFRRMLYRHFPGWEIEALTCGMDLQRSLSPVFPRAYLRRGLQSIAAMACPHPSEESALLTFALIWHDHLSTTKGQGSPPLQLCLFLPEEAGTLTAQRLQWLTGRKLAVRLFRFNEHGSAGEVDPQDLGNLETRVATSVMESSADCRSKAMHPPGPEQLLEEMLRREIQIIDAALRSKPIYGQVLTFVGVDRDLIDLLAVSVSGQLTVLELKVTEDAHLPLQALDYWMRIAWHAKQNELNRLFPGIPIPAKLPRLLLIAPAMSFHSTNTTVLSYFSPGVEVERIGINEGWRQAIRVMLRLRGPDLPISHRSLE